MISEFQILFNVILVAAVSLVIKCENKNTEGWKTKNWGPKYLPILKRASKYYPE